MIPCAAPIREVPYVDDQNRPRYNRDKLRGPSRPDRCGVGAYQVPLIPPAKRGGAGKRRVDMRQLVNGVMYISSTGCQWRYIPAIRRRAAR